MLAEEHPECLHSLSLRFTHSASQRYLTADVRHRNMARLLIGFVIGTLVCLTTSFLLSLRFPFPQSSLDREHNKYLHLFVAAPEHFFTGSEDADSQRISFSFTTSFKDAKSYFSAVDANITGTDWHLVEQYNTFRRYADTWTPFHSSNRRKEITLTYLPKQQKVILEKQRRLDLSGL